MNPGDDSLIDELDDELVSTSQQVGRRALEGIVHSAKSAQGQHARNLTNTQQLEQFDLGETELIFNS